MNRKYLLIILMLVSINTYAHVNCEAGAIGVNFGNYDPFATSPDDSIGIIGLSCDGDVNYTISLSKGVANTYQPRRMNSNLNRLNYNLYINTNRIIIWGDGTQSTQTVKGKCDDNQTKQTTRCIIPVYGRIPAQQDAAVGNYSDTIIVTINF